MLKMEVSAHEEDQESVVRISLDSHLDRSPCLVPHVGDVRPKGKHRSDSPLGRHGGCYGISVGTASATADETNESEDKLTGSEIKFECPVSLRVRQEVQTVLRPEGRLIGLLYRSGHTSVSAAPSL